jgi:hypothetical protein
MWDISGTFWDKMALGEPTKLQRPAPMCTEQWTFRILSLWRSRQKEKQDWKN